MDLNLYRARGGFNYEGYPDPTYYNAMALIKARERKEDTMTTNETIIIRPGEIRTVETNNGVTLDTLVLADPGGTVLCAQCTDVQPKFGHFITYQDPSSGDVVYADYSRICYRRSSTFVEKRLELPGVDRARVAAGLADIFGLGAEQPEAAPDTELAVLRAENELLRKMNSDLVKIAMK